MMIRTQLIPDPNHSVALSTIRQIRVGTNRYARCVNLIFAQRTLIIKVRYANFQCVVFQLSKAIIYI